MFEFYICYSFVNIHKKLYFKKYKIRAMWKLKKKQQTHENPPKRLLITDLFCFLNKAFTQSLNLALKWHNFKKSFINHRYKLCHIFIYPQKNPVSFGLIKKSRPKKVYILYTTTTHFMKSFKKHLTRNQGIKQETIIQKTIHLVLQCFSILREKIQSRTSVNNVTAGILMHLERWPHNAMCTFEQREIWHRRPNQRTLVKLEIRCG